MVQMVEMVDPEANFSMYEKPKSIQWLEAFFFFFFLDAFCLLTA